MSEKESEVSLVGTYSIAALGGGNINTINTSLPPTGDRLPSMQEQQQQPLHRMTGRSGGASTGFTLPPISKPVIQQPQVVLSKLEKCVPRLIEVYLRDFDWLTGFGSFFKTTTPLFEGFREVYDTHHRSVSGRGFDIQMHSIHQEFLNLVMDMLSAQFEDLGYSEEKFVAAILAGTSSSSMTSSDNIISNNSSSSSNSSADPASKKLLGFIDGLASFESFGWMMQDTFDMLYGSGSAGSHSINGHDNIDTSVVEERESPVRALLRPPRHARALPSPLTAVHRMVHQQGLKVAPTTTAFTNPAANTTAIHCVRVLWDIENVSVSKREGGMNSVSRLHTFLGTKGLFGAGIDLRITAFFNPVNGGVSKQTTTELDKAAVELVWVSSKREDADRKLGMRVNQEMQVLPPTSTAFVIITSDQDFRHHFQLLSNAGYRVMVLHGAPPGKWEQALSMHCTESYSWPRDVMLSSSTSSSHSRHHHNNQRDGGVDPHSVPAPDGDRGGEEGGGSRRKQRQHNYHRQDKAKTHSGTVATSVAGCTETTPLLLPPAGRWIAGACKAWKGKFGFITVTIGGSAVDVFAHASVLPVECRGVLTPEEAVEMTVDQSEKGGLKAVNVKRITH